MSSLLFNKQCYGGGNAINLMHLHCSVGVWDESCNHNKMKSTVDLL